jgi:hypothetical protein
MVGNDVLIDEGFCGQIGNTGILTLKLRKFKKVKGRNLPPLGVVFLAF